MRPRDPSKNDRPRKPSFPLLLDTLLAYRAWARSPEELDRRRVLTRLEHQFGVEAAELELRGFDRAYRLVVEGV